LKFLIDAQLPPSLEAWFGSKGYEARHVASLMKADAPDAEIWNFAVTGDYVIVTKDRDFVEWARNRTPRTRIVWVRLGNMRRDLLHARLETAWRELEIVLAGETTVIEIGH
jgi:predicted nuclease of predicted toxin-antitoxin system